MTATDVDDARHDGRLPSLSSPIRIVGEETATVGADRLAALPMREREYEIVCSTGDRYTETWRGFPLFEVLEAAPTSLPPATTHLLVDSDDGHRACVAIGPALEGVLAVGKNGESLADTAGYDTRFVAPVEGPRTVKGVSRLEAVALESGEDPQEYERLTPTE